MSGKGEDGYDDRANLNPGFSYFEERMQSVQFDIWSLLLSFGVFQGLFITPIILKTKRQPSYFLAGLVLIISLNVLNYLFLSSRLYQVFPHYVFIPNAFFFWMGPFYYFYIRSVAEPGFRFQLKRYWLHFTPILLGIAYYWPFLTLSGQGKIEFFNNYFALEQLPASWMVTTFFSLNIIQSLIYILLARKVLVKQQLEANGSKRGKYLKWLSQFSIVFAVYWLIDFLGLIWLTVADGFFHAVDYIIMLSSALIVHVLAYVAVSKNSIFQTVFLGAKALNKAKSGLEEKEVMLSLDRLTRLMEVEKPYLNPELKMNELAGRVDLSSNDLSMLLNDHLGKTFYEFVNDYRLEEVKSKLSNPAFSNYTILGIAVDSGFNNKNTFNRYFKKETGLTPSDYLKKSS